MQSQEKQITQVERQNHKFSTAILSSRSKRIPFHLGSLQQSWHLLLRSASLIKVWLMAAIHRCKMLHAAKVCVTMYTGYIVLLLVAFLSISHAFFRNDSCCRISPTQWYFTVCMLVSLKVRKFASCQVEKLKGKPLMRLRSKGLMHSPKYSHSPYPIPREFWREGVTHLLIKVLR